MNLADFSQRLITWQQQHGRHDLAWQVNDAYCVWLSEIMLQQTQVSTVAQYYPRFIAAFPTVQDLANAEQDAVLALWQGLGYYTRARSLHKAAKQIVENFGGELPCTRAELETLCGVGRSTAAAIAAFAFQQRETILDGNVKRILCRIFAQDGDASDKKFEQQLWALAESLMPSENAQMPAYTQGLMDLGATVCKRSKPLCEKCPMADICQAKAQNRIAQLPRKKARVAVKTLPLYWLILRDATGALWLEKRPQTGIWGGLYCVPCFESLADLHDFVCRLSFSDGILHDLLEHNEISHQLTHRLLLITPFSLQINKMPSEKYSDGIWVPAQNWADYGLPKPLATFLAQL